MSKHTPGPWRTQPCPAGGLVLLRGDGHTQQPLQVVPAADAELMADAPALLDALEALCSVRCRPYPDEFMDDTDDYGAALDAWETSHALLRKHGR